VIFGQVRGVSGRIAVALADFAAPAPRGRLPRNGQRAIVRVVRSDGAEDDPDAIGAEPDAVDRGANIDWVELAV